MACVELKVQFENASLSRLPVTWQEVESLRAALADSLDTAIRSFSEGLNRGVEPFAEDSEHLNSGLERSGSGYVLFFQYNHAAPESCGLFEQFATDVIQCAASTHLWAGFGLGVGSILPHLYENKVLLFWGSFTRHAPSSALTKLALYSSSCRFEKTLDPTEYKLWVRNFDRLLAGLAAGHGEVRGEARLEHDTYPPNSQDHVDPLAAVADARDEDVFARELSQIARESLTKDEYLRLVGLALGAGAHRSARELAREARDRFPDSEDVQRFAKILGEPELLASEQPSSVSIDEHTWLKSNAEKFSGQWVVLRKGDLLGHGSSLSEVRKGIGSLSGLFVTRVP